MNRIYKNDQFFTYVYRGESFGLSQVFPHTFFRCACYIIINHVCAMYR